MGETAFAGGRGVNALAHLPWDSVAMNPCRFLDLPFSKSPTATQFPALRQAMPLTWAYG
jgi:hypothetical protein